ncbi:helix-turn-helix transcriptional regulator, partial [uncultured Pseudoflavonifractor sp.]
FNEKSGLFPYIQEVGKRVRKAEISTLIEICAIIESRRRGGADMNIKLTIPERLKDLRIERGLTLEQLSEATGISRAALGKYEADDFKDISPFSIAALAKFYGVSADYLMGLTETKNHPNTELEALHLGDGAIEVLKGGQFNHRLLSELICHKDFQRLMLDAEIYVDRIADMRINDMNAVLEAVRQMVLAKREDGANDLYLRTLELAQVPEEEYFGHVVADDLTGILCDIREAHKTDSTTADESSAAAQVQQQLQTAINFEGSSDEKKARAFLATFGIDYDAITKEQFITLIEILRLSKHMKSPISQRGRASMTHGKGKRKRK